MDLIGYWNALAPEVYEQCGLALPKQLELKQELDALSAECGGMLLVHRMGDVLPFYISPSVDKLLDGASSGLSVAGLLSFLTRQNEPLHLAWKRFKTQVESGVEAPRCVALLVNDVKENEHWVCGSCGVLGTDAEGRMLLMGLFFDMEQVGPIRPAIAQVPSGSDEMLQRLLLLSDRERQVLALILAELPVAEIGKRLHVSTHTIHSHRKNLMNKLGARTRMALTNYLPLLALLQEQH